MPELGLDSHVPTAGAESNRSLTILLYSARVFTGPSWVLNQPGLSMVSSNMPRKGFPSGVMSLNWLGLRQWEMTKGPTHQTLTFIEPVCMAAPEGTKAYTTCPTKKPWWLLPLFCNSIRLSQKETRWSLRYFSFPRKFS